MKVLRNVVAATLTETPICYFGRFVTDSVPDEPIRPTGRRLGFTSLGANYQPPTIEEVQALVPRDEVLSFIGHGGMGTYYKASQRRLDRLVAIKILIVDSILDAKLIEGFKREATAMARLIHSNIIKINDFGEADSKLFMIMEYIEGHTLEYLNDTHGFKLKDTLIIMEQICDALEFAHKKGVVHRDLRLGNTMLDQRRGVKVGDFGLARLIGEELFRRNLIGENRAMGTMEYVAPEEQDPNADVDHRADIFSLGVMLYKLVARKLPGEEFVPPSHFVSDLNPLIDRIVIRCMQSDPDKRYQNVAEFRAMLSMLDH